MKYLLPFLIAILICPALYSQDSLKLEYQGGDNAFKKFMYKRIHSIPEEWKHDRYFEISVKILKDGKFGDFLEMTCIDNDSSAMPTELRDLIKQTENKWKNLTSKDLYLIIPFYFMYEDRDNKKPKIPEIAHEIYNNGSKLECIRFEPFIIEMYPPVSYK